MLPASDTFSANVTSMTDQYEYGRVVEVECESGYQWESGTNLTLVCGGVGQWDPPFTSCQRKQYLDILNICQLNVICGDVMIERHGLHIAFNQTCLGKFEMNPLITVN